jgi:hypothetical protein
VPDFPGEYHPTAVNGPFTAVTNHSWAISTVDLFQVWGDVMAGRREKEDVRRVMREAKGRFTVESLAPLA